MINNQNQRKAFLVIIAILLIANIAMLAFFLQKQGPEKQGGRPDKKAMLANFLKSDIGFNQQQLIQYDTLSNLHREKIRNLFDSARNNKNEQFKKLAEDNFNNAAINLAADQSAAFQKIIELQMFNHIKNIRLICTPEQLPKFDSLFYKVFNNRRGERKKATK